MISVVIPAHNEAQYIGPTVRSVIEAYAVANELPRVIVILDSCTDETERIAIAAGAQVAHVEFRNRAKTRNYGAKLCDSRHPLIFVDADTIVALDLIQKTLLAMSSSRSSVFYYFQQPLENVTYHRLYFIFMNICGTWMPLFSPVIAVRQDWFRESAGFNERLKSLEDIAFLARAHNHHRVGRIPALVYTSIRRVEKFGLFHSSLSLCAAFMTLGKHPWKAIHEC